MCGGHQLRPLGGDRFECVAQLPRGEQLVGVVPRGPYQPVEVPVYQPVYGPCGHRFTGQQASAADEERSRQALHQANVARVQSETARAEAAKREQQRAWEQSRDAKVNEALPPLPRPPPPPPLEMAPMKYLRRSVLGSVVLGWAVTVAVSPKHFSSALGDPKIVHAWATIAGASLLLSLTVGIAWGVWAIVNRGDAVRAHDLAVRAADHRDYERTRLREVLQSKRTA